MSTFPNLPSMARAVYVLDLTVRNVRCFGPEEQTLRLSNAAGQPAQWTVILSDNGAGKTTLLQCIVALEPSRRRTYFVSEARPNDGPLVSVPCTGADGWRIFRAPENPSATSISGTLALFFYRLSLHPFRFKVVPTSYRSIEEDMWKSVYHEGNPIEFIDFDHEVAVFAYGATRLLGSARSLRRGEVPDRALSLFRDDVELIDAENWLLQEDYARRLDESSSGGQTHSSSGEPSRFDRTKRLLLDLLPGVTDLRITNRQVAGEGRSHPSIEALTSYGWVAMSDLSLGYRSMIAWTVDLASRMFDRYPNSPNPLAEPAVVLVDEIDLHLHPKWQRQIKSHLLERFPNTQFIVTAHSPLVVQASENENIVVLRREGDHVVIDNDVETVRGWRVDQVLTSDLFGLSSARPPEYEALINERNALLEKTHLSTEEEARLRALGNEITSLPTGETPADLEAMEIIRQAAAELKTRQTSE